MITLFVFVMMLILDYLSVLTKGRMNILIKGGQWRQYIVSSFLGSTPGCLGAFLNVSFYVHGFLSFGALVGGMIATSGDEAFVMLALFPKQALLLFGLLFFFGIILGWISDKMARVLKIRPSEECRLQQVHENDSCTCFDKQTIVNNYVNLSALRLLILLVILVVLTGVTLGVLGSPSWDWKRVTFIALISVAGVIIGTVPEHFLHEHVWRHIVRKHLWRVFLWSFGAILVVEFGLSYWNLEGFVKNHMEWIGLIAVLLAIVPESGPHLLFVMLYTRGLIPFSILLASSIVQDGHGMLPLLSYTIRDSILIKLFNLAFGISIGLVFFLAGY
jgi:hypothetical protein